MQSDQLEEYRQSLSLLRAHGYYVGECAMMNTKEIREGYENIALPRTLAHSLSIAIKASGAFKLTDFEV